LQVFLFDGRYIVTVCSTVPQNDFFCFTPIKCHSLIRQYDKILGHGRWFSKMFIDVYIHTPFVLIPSFYGITGSIKGQSVDKWSSQLRNEWLVASFGSVLYWTPMQCVAFGFVPQHSRIAFISCGSFLHKAWLSWLSNPEVEIDEGKCIPNLNVA